MPQYAPSLTAELEGGVAVAAFDYFPGKDVPVDVLYSTAASTLHVSESVPDYIANAIRLEFRRAGLSVKPESACSLTGEINDFTRHIQFSNSGWSSEFHYVLRDAQQQVLFDRTYRTEFDTAFEPFYRIEASSLSKLISDVVKPLIDEPAFRRAVTERCPKA
jgi:hypothetical protein